MSTLRPSTATADRASLKTVLTLNSTLTYVLRAGKLHREQRDDQPGREELPREDIQGSRHGREDHELHGYVSGVGTTSRITTMPTSINPSVSTTLLGPTHHYSKIAALYKEVDYKVAFVTLPKDHAFEFPDVVGTDKLAESKEKARGEVKEAQRTFDKQVKTHRQPGRKGLPSFFGL